MASVWKRGRYWYVSYFDRTGKRVTTSSHMTNHRDAEQLAAGLEAKEIMARRLGVDPREERINGHHEKPIADQLAEWKADIIARGNTAKHAHEQHFMAESIVAYAAAKTLADLQPSAVSAALGKLREEKLSLNTLNHYLRAIKAFSRWLWRDGRSRADPLFAIKGYRAKTDRRRIRRAMSMDEIRRLLRAADHGATVLGVRGKDRGMLYRFMLGTGLRVSEVKSLRVRHFLWDFKPAVVVVDAAYSKHRREDHQPMRDELAAMLRPWMKRRKLKPEDHVFKMPDKPNRMLVHDLAAAKPPIPEKNPSGVLDLHALRHTFVTECVKHFPPKIAQQLARHASITLTMDLYTHLETAAAGDALANSGFYDGKPQPKEP